MARKEEIEPLASLVDALELARSAQSVILIGAGTAPTELPSAIVIADLATANEIPGDLKAEIGIVDHASRRSDKPTATQLLARLRDVHCERIYVLAAEAILSRNDLLAIGFVPVDVANGLPAGTYVHDPALANPPREWNNADNWANPQNFDKRRW